MMRAPAALGPEEPGLDRVWTVPNGLSLLRLVLLGIALAVLFADRARVLAAVLLAVAGSTDFLDGYVARHLGQVSNLGKILDPTVDRIVLGATTIGIIVYGALPAWLAGIVLAREALVAIAGIGLALAGAARVDVIWLGKAATFGLLVTLPLFLLGDGSGALTHGVRIAAYVIGLPSAAASLIALGYYFPLARRALAEGRGGRGPGAPAAAGSAR